MAVLEDLANTAINPCALPCNRSNSSLLHPMSVESLIFGYPDQTVLWIEKILPLLEKVGFKNVPNVAGETAILINDDPMTRRASIIKVRCETKCV